MGESGLSIRRSGSDYQSTTGKGSEVFLCRSTSTTTVVKCLEIVRYCLFASGGGGASDW